MRRQLLLTVTASTLVVLAAFFVPLAWLIRTSTADRATSAATVGVQPLAAVVGVADEATLGLVVSQVRSTIGDPVTVFLGDGKILGDQRPLTQSVKLAQSGRAFSADLPGGGREVLIPVQGRAEGTAVVRVEIPASSLQAGVARSWLLLGALGLALLALALIVADALARSFLRPLYQLTDTVTRLGTGDLSAQARPAGPPEVAEAGRAVNRLTRRIQALLAAERESVADLSHRLRTPVSALRLDAEDLHDPVERDRLTRDVAGLSRAVDQLIDEARRPVREGVRVECDAVAVVSSRCAFWTVLAEDTDRRMTLNAPSEPLPVRLTVADLANAVDALLENVFAHTPEGTALDVRLLARPDGGALLVVEDDGPGLPGPEVLRRGESTAGSTGLGLDIVRRSAEASGGGLRFATGARAGLRVLMELGPPQ